MAVTAKVYEEDKQQVLQAGFNEHVNNPVDMDVLLSVIAALLQKSQMQSL